jgi:hypothetical protein
MLITYRRTAGPFALLMLAAVALAATVLTAAVAAVMLIVGLVVAAGVVLARTVLPRSWLYRTVPPATRWRHDTIEGTVVTATSASDGRDLHRLGSDKG